MKYAAVAVALVLAGLSGGVSAQENSAEQGAAREGQRQRPDPFARLFTLPGIEFSAEQQARVKEIRGEFTPKLLETQRKWDGVITAEQQQARREAFARAREAGKQGQELRRATESAVQLTQAQKKQQANIRQERNDLQREIRDRLLALLTEEQRTTVMQRFRGPEPSDPTHSAVNYGPHERNLLDVWLAKSDRPTPVLISIHGGGFRAGNRSVGGGMLNQCLAAGISVVAITYRFSSDAVAPASFHDSARAVQYVRHRAKEWNFDPTRIAATGSSAGAGLSLWLAFHDDLAKPDSEDPVLRQSSRLTCAAVTAGQTSYDPRVIRSLFPDTDTYRHSALAELFDYDPNELDNLPPEKYRLFEECSPMHHLSKDDVPVMLNYGGGLDQEITSASIGIHHARFGKALKEKMDQLGLRCIVHAGGQMLDGGERLQVIDFLKEEFGLQP